MNKEELKELAATLNGIADGKAWESADSCYFSPVWEEYWSDDPISAIEKGYKIRLKPEQRKVPFQPSDVPPGSAFRFNNCSDGHYYMPSLVSGDSDGVYFKDAAHFKRDYTYLMEHATINRSIPLTGKWNPEAWEPCYKLIDTP